VERLIEIKHEQPTVKEPVLARPLKEFKSQITFENVSFSYRREPVLKEIEFDDSARVSGSASPAKAAPARARLTNLIFRFYDPTSGAVKIDGIDLREISFLDSRRQMALVSQEIVLFNMTVAENIACGKPMPPAPRDRGRRPCRVRARFYHGEGGGLRHARWRARRRVVGRPATTHRDREGICAQRTHLVLDEATASLDSQSEAEVQAAIDHLAENRTVVCVCPSSLHACCDGPNHRLVARSQSSNKQFL